MRPGGDGPATDLVASRLAGRSRARRASASAACSPASARRGRRRPPSRPRGRPRPAPAIQRPGRPRVLRTRRRRRPRTPGGWPRSWPRSRPVRRTRPSRPGRDGGAASSSDEIGQHLELGVHSRADAAVGLEQAAALPITTDVFDSGRRRAGPLRPAIERSRPERRAWPARRAGHDHAPGRQTGPPPNWRPGPGPPRSLSPASARHRPRAAPRGRHQHPARSRTEYEVPVGGPVVAVHLDQGEDRLCRRRCPRPSSGPAGPSSTVSTSRGPATPRPLPANQRAATIEPRSNRPRAAAMAGLSEPFDHDVLDTV